MQGLGFGCGVQGLRFLDLKMETEKLEVYIFEVFADGAARFEI